MSRASILGFLTALTIGVNGAGADEIEGNVVQTGLHPVTAAVTLTPTSPSTETIELCTDSAMYFKVEFTAQEPDGTKHQNFVYYCILGVDEGSTTDAEATLFGPASDGAWQTQKGVDFNSLFELKSGWLWISSDPIPEQGARLDPRTEPIANPHSEPDGHFRGIFADADTGLPPVTMGVMSDAAQLDPIAVGWSILTIVRTPRTRGGAPGSKYVMHKVVSKSIDAKVYNLSDNHEAAINTSQREIDDPQLISEITPITPHEGWLVQEYGPGNPSKWVLAQINFLTPSGNPDLNFLNYVASIEEGFEDGTETGSVCGD